MSHPAPTGLGSVFPGGAIHISLLAELACGGLCNATMFPETPIKLVQPPARLFDAFEPFVAPAGPDVNSRGRQPTVGRAQTESALKGPNSLRLHPPPPFDPSGVTQVSVLTDRGLAPTAIHIAALRAASILARSVERKQARRAAMFIAPSHQNRLKLHRSAMSHLAPTGLGSVFPGKAIHIPLLAELDYGGPCNVNLFFETPIMSAQPHAQSSGALATASTLADTVEKRQRTAALRNATALLLPEGTSTASLQRRGIARQRRNQRSADILVRFYRAGRSRSGRECPRSLRALSVSALNSMPAFRASVFGLLSDFGLRTSDLSLLYDH
jgi:hypothetical protein